MCVPFRVGVRAVMLVASRLDRSETHTGLPPRHVARGALVLRAGVVPSGGGRRPRAGGQAEGGEDPVRVVRARAVGEDGAAAMLEMQAGAVLRQGVPELRVGHAQGVVQGAPSLSLGITLSECEDL